MKVSASCRAGSRNSRTRADGPGTRSRISAGAHSTSLDGDTGWDGTILDGIEPGQHLLFRPLVHRRARRRHYRLADCDYHGRRISAALQAGNVFGTQFHPEKAAKPDCASAQLPYALSVPVTPPRDRGAARHAHGSGETSVQSVEPERACRGRPIVTPVTVRLIPNRKIEGLGLDEIWAYRELIFGPAHRDLMAIKNQTPTAWFWRILAADVHADHLHHPVPAHRQGRFQAGIPYFFVMSAAMLALEMISVGDPRRGRQHCGKCRVFRQGVFPARSSFPCRQCHQCDCGLSW